MSDLTGIGIDIGVAEDDGSGGRVIVPKAKYKAVMVFESLNDNNAGTGKTYETRWQIVDGPHSDVVLRDWLNIINPNAQAQRIGQGQLKRICRITGVPFPPPDATQMFGKPVLLTVNVKPDRKDKAKLQNEITAYNLVPADFIAGTETNIPAVTQITPATEEANAVLDEDW